MPNKDEKAKETGEQAAQELADDQVEGVNGGISSEPVYRRPASLPSLGLDSKLDGPSLVGGGHILAGK